MTVYTPNIPQSGDNPSNSQDQILQNFQTLNSVYGTSGDHYPWTNSTPGEGNKHAKVTLPGLPTANAPGNAIPAPLAGNCTIFGQTRPGSGQTYPYLARDGLAPTAPLTNIWPLLPIKAYVTFDTDPSVVSPTNIGPIDSFNITSPVVQTNGAGVFTWTFTITNACRTTNYSVFWSSPSGTLNFDYVRDSATQFRMTRIAGPTTAQRVCVFVVES